MTKNINIILKKNQDRLGLVGEIKTVAKGYARNYLIPNNIVEVATKNKTKHMLMLEKAKDKKILEEKLKAVQIQQYLEKIQKIKLRKKVSDQDNKQIFGSVTEKEIIEKIVQTTGVSLDKRNIELPVIKTIGIYKINIKIANDINTNLILQILPETLV